MTTLMFGISTPIPMAAVAKTIRDQPEPGFFLHKREKPGNKVVQFTIWIIIVLNYFTDSIAYEKMCSALKNKSLKKEL